MSSLLGFNDTNLEEDTDMDALEKEADEKFEEEWKKISWCVLLSPVVRHALIDSVVAATGTAPRTGSAWTTLMRG